MSEGKGRDVPPGGAVCGEPRLMAVPAFLCTAPVQSVRKARLAKSIDTTDVTVSFSGEWKRV